MQVVVFKSNEVSSEVYYNYGDDYERVTFCFNSIEQVREVSSTELKELNGAIQVFNKVKVRNYRLSVAEIIEKSEMDTLLSNFHLHEEKMAERAAKAEATRLKNAEIERANREKLAQERKLKKLAKELGLSVDEVRAKLAL